MSKSTSSRRTSARLTRAPLVASATVILFAFCDDPTRPSLEESRKGPSANLFAGSAMIVAAGDIGRCELFTKDDSTAKLVREYPDATVLTLGDHAFPRNGSPAATTADYVDCYGPNWGQPDIKSRTLPAPGDLDTLNAFADYFGFFGDVARGPAGQGYYSTDIGEWHVIALNSSIRMDATSEQYTWLKNDLALNTRNCTLAYWHFPRYSSYGTTPVRGSVKPLWDLLYAAGADVVLNAHLRGYERVGAGDIAQCTNNDDEATAKLLDGIAGTVFTFGDNAYTDGTADEYRRCYDPPWGRHKGRTYAAIGNHEYHTPNATPTFDYFGPRVGPRGKGYYSYDMGAWHVIVLNRPSAADLRRSACGRCATATESSGARRRPKMIGSDA